MMFRNGVAPRPCNTTGHDKLLPLLLTHLKMMNCTASYICSRLLTPAPIKRDVRVVRRR